METFANDIEFRPAEEIKAFQEQLLQKALHYLAGHSAYYRRMFERCEICIDQIRHIEDLVKIPFTEKKDLQLFNEEFLCCPRETVIDYVTTSGTLGDPVTFGCTELDLQRLAYNEKKSFACAGLRPGNIVQLMTTLDKRFMAGLAYFLGIRELGASVIRVGNGIPELQWDTIRRLKPDTIMCVPSFILRLIQYAEEHDIDYRRSSIRRIIGIGEGLREQDFSLNLLGQRIREKWDVQLFATYSSTEMGATFSECEYGCGGHIHPELIIVEIIGPDNLPVADGEYGEIIMGGAFTGLPTELDAPTTKTTGAIIVTIPFLDLHGAKVGLLVCACGGGEARMRDIAKKYNAEVVSVTFCKQAIEVKPGAPRKCENPGNCPGQIAKVLEMKRAGAEYLIIGNCSDCSNTVVTCGTLKMGLKVIHQTDHVMRTIHHPLYRHLTISKTVDQDLSEF